MNPHPNPPTLPRLFVIGDSISIHYGPCLEKLLAGKFQYARKEDLPGKQAAANLDIPQGANGGDSAMVLAYLRARAASDPIQAEVLMLNCGLHDIKTDPLTGTRQIPETRYEQNLRACLTEAGSMNLPVIWLNTTPVFDEVHNSRVNDFHRFSTDVDSYNAIAGRVMREAGVPVIDLHGFTLQFLPDGYCDHVHFTEELRHRQAIFLAGVLEHWRAMFCDKPFRP